MSESDQSRAGTPRRADQLATTHWSIVIAAGHRSSPESGRALGTLCETYWYPAYVYIRRRGFSVDEADDLTQAFFACVLEKNYIRQADREKGKFRAFFLTALGHFLSKERDKAKAQKRGGGVRPLPLDFQTAQGRYSLEPAQGLTPDQAFERTWAMTVLENALKDLRTWYVERGKSDQFDRLKVYLEGKGSDNYSQAADELGLSEAAVKQEVHRLRKRCKDCIRKEIGHTVATPKEIDEEIRRLFLVFSR